MSAVFASHLCLRFVWWLILFNFNQVTARRIFLERFPKSLLVSGFVSAWFFAWYCHPSCNAFSCEMFGLFAVSGSIAIIGQLRFRWLSLSSTPLLGGPGAYYVLLRRGVPSSSARRVCLKICLKIVDPAWKTLHFCCLQRCDGARARRFGSLQCPRSSE